MLSPAHILIADDHVVVREGLKALFERQADLQVTAEAVDGMDAVDKTPTPGIDLAILDVAIPCLTGLQAVREISRRRSELPILLLSMYDREQYFFEAVAAGAVGYVLKRQADRDLVEACRAALRGESFIYPPALSAIMRRYLERVQRGEDPGTSPLTPRETQVVKLVAEGHSSQDIA